MEKELIEFSFIVPVYKINYNSLNKCIRSLIDQCYKGTYEIILVDDGSPDDCGNICDEYAKKKSNIKVIHQKNQGVSAARNSGIMIARGEWIVFVDADDWSDKNTLESIAKVTEQNKSLDIIIFNYSRDYQNNESKIENIPIDEGRLCTDNLNSIRIAPFCKLFINGKQIEYSVNGVNTKAYRRLFLLNNKLFFNLQARKGQDRLFNAEALLLTDNIYYLNKCLFHYNCYSDSITNKYNDKIVMYTKIEINHLNKLIYNYNLNSSYQKYLNTRTLTRMYSCLRLYYFNPKYPYKYKDAKKDILLLITEEFFIKALSFYDSSLLNTKEKIFVHCLKKKWIFLIKCLVKLQSKRNDKRL